jgi:hypothetical protein
MAQLRSRDIACIRIQAAFPVRRRDWNGATSREEPVSDAFNVNHNVTSSRECAVLAVYLGYELVRVEVAPDKSEQFTLVCPECDFSQVVSEAASDLTTVCYASIQKINSLVGGHLAYAKKFAVWSSFTKVMTPERHENRRNNGKLRFDR